MERLMFPHKHVLFNEPELLAIYTRKFQQYTIRRTPLLWIS